MIAKFFIKMCFHGLAALVGCSLIGCAHVDVVPGPEASVPEAEVAPLATDLHEPVARLAPEDATVAAAVEPVLEERLEPSVAEESAVEAQPAVEAAMEAQPASEVSDAVGIEAQEVAVPEEAKSALAAAPELEAAEEAQPEVVVEEPVPAPKPVQNRITHYQAALKLIEEARMDEAFPRMLEDIMKPYKMELRTVPVDFWTAFGEKVDYTAVRKALADRYVAEFSQNELAELTAFYSSPVGRKLVDRNLEIQRVFSVDSRNWVRKTRDLLTRELKSKSYMY